MGGLKARLSPARLALFGALSLAGTVLAVKATGGSPDLSLPPEPIAGGDALRLLLYAWGSMSLGVLLLGVGWRLRQLEGPGVYVRDYFSTHLEDGRWVIYDRERLPWHYLAYAFAGASFFWALLVFTQLVWATFWPVPVEEWYPTPLSPAASLLRPRR